VESGDQFCVDAFGKNQDSFTVKMFSYLIHLIKKCYKLCAFSVICRNNTAINCVAVQQKKRFIPINFDGSFYSSHPIKEDIGIMLYPNNFRRNG
jgi:hypothetical protein